MDHKWSTYSIKVPTCTNTQYFFKYLWMLIQYRYTYHTSNIYVCQRDLHHYSDEIMEGMCFPASHKYGHML